MKAMMLPNNDAEQKLQKRAAVNESHFKVRKVPVVEEEEAAQTSAIRVSGLDASLPL